MQAENAEICKRLRSQLGKSHDMARILLRIKKARTKREGGGTGAYGREVEGGGEGGGGRGMQKRQIIPSGDRVLCSTLSWRAPLERASN